MGPLRYVTDMERLAYITVYEQVNQDNCRSKQMEEVAPVEAMTGKHGDQSAKKPQGFKNNCCPESPGLQRPQSPREHQCQNAHDQEYGTGSGCYAPNKAGSGVADEKRNQRD